MMLTDRTEIQKTIDEKFKKYKQITKEAIKEKERLKEKFKKSQEEMKQRIAENEKECMEHIKRLKESGKIFIESGCSEYSNMLVSLHNHQYVMNNNRDA